MQDGVCVERHEGTPQGGPLSPLLANLLLDDLDKELERRGHRFCRYADDCNIYVRSPAAGERVMASVTAFLENRLKLKVNRQKSAVARVGERQFLGHRLGKQGTLGIGRKSLARAKGKLRAITRRNRGMSPERMIEAVNRFAIGWVTSCQIVRPVLYMPSSASSKEDRARAIARQDGIEQGLICTLTAVEPCLSYEIVRDREARRLRLEPRHRKCLFLYHYQIHPIFGFMHARATQRRLLLLAYLNDDRPVARIWSFVRPGSDVTSGHGD